MSKANAPTKGVRPQTAGVAGTLVDQAPAEITFGATKRLSPYDPLLQQLKAAGAGKFLRFDDLRARPSVTARAKKLGIKVMFGEQGNVLWVTLARFDLHGGGVVEEQPKPRSNSDIVLDAIDAKRDSAGAITTFARSAGATGIGVTQVEGLLGTLARAGKIKLKKNLTGSSDGERWERR